MAVAIRDENLWILALDTVEAARDDGVPIPKAGSVAYEVELAEVVLLLVQRLGLDIDEHGSAAGPT